MRPSVRTLLLSALFVAASSQAADVWRWKDAQGIVHYGDVPIEGAERVRTSSSAGSSASSTAAVNSPAPTPTPYGLARLEEQRQLDVANKAVQQDLAKKRLEQCKKATERYESLITSNRVYREDSKGQRAYLNAKDLDETRVRARQERDAVCNNPVR